MATLYHIVVELEDEHQIEEAYRFWTGQTFNKLTKKLKEQTSTRNVHDWRFGTLKIENLHMDEESSTGLVEANFEGSGIVHLFRTGQNLGEKSKNDVQNDLKLTRVAGSDTTVAILFVPSYLTSRETLFSFLGDTVLEQASHFRIVRSSAEFLVLVKFRTAEFAHQFIQDFDGRNFNAIDPNTCHVVQIREIIFQHGLFPSAQTKPPAFPMVDPFTASDYQHVDVELPTCPVCLERLDSEVTGLATIPCQHTFHCRCLNSWKDSRCPVCRYSELKISKKSLIRGSARCSSCGSNENLWICLICGNIGCGRYNYKHAVQHFTDTGHFFAMEMATQRVWDYAGDNYVHRLVQNEVDGKLVEVGSSSSQTAGGKRDKQYHLEYVQVLLSQLESQRDYYENKLQLLSDETKAEKVKQDDLCTLQSLQQQMQELKLSAAQSRIKSEQHVAQLRKQVQEEKSFSDALQSNLDHLAKKEDQLKRQLEQNNAEKQDLQEQVRDLMFFLESNEKLKNAGDDVKEGTVIMKPKKSTSKKRK
ncbi:LAFA_0F07778g1_1 [Lachancea sp. 'fantastica']|nr:LAFA_0F07778g1_1 [Lachancea sp. 'fantastica']